MTKKAAYDPGQALAALEEALNDRTRVDMVYMGRHYKAPKMWVVYAVIHERDNNGSPIPKACEVRYYQAEKGGRNFVQGMPGAIYAFPENKEKGTIVTSAGVYLGLWRNKEDCKQWIAQDRAAELAQAQEAAKAKELKRNLALETLKPFREAYRAMGHKDRGLLLAWIIGEITK